MTRWLNADEQRAWRSFIFLSHYVDSIASASFSAHGLSENDYHVLVPLSESLTGRLPFTDLVEFADREPGLLSRHLERMEERELVRREQSFGASHGFLVSITEAGRAAIEAAAPTHVSMIREFFIDRLGANDLSTLESMAAKVLPPDQLKWTQ